MVQMELIGKRQHHLAGVDDRAQVVGHFLMGFHGRVFGHDLAIRNNLVQWSADLHPKTGKRFLGYSRSSDLCSVIHWPAPGLECCREISTCLLIRRGLGSPHWVRAASLHSRSTIFTGLSMVAESILPSDKLTTISSLNISLPAAARYFPSSRFCTSTQLLGVSATGWRIHSAVSLTSGFFGGT